ncbi:MAG: hypothetical protein IPO07_21575 [Haliscomenobacter sp.]|nr:hypothetical protein [Haliscomenobacter sp.]MBK9491090.1 hypothetical protein [Haliscomenobacter sp.]
MYRVDDVRRPLEKHTLSRAKLVLMLRERGIVFDELFPLLLHLEKHVRIMPYEPRNPAPFAL